MNVMKYNYALPTSTVTSHTQHNAACWKL